MAQLEDDLLTLICSTCNIPKPELAEFDMTQDLIGPDSQLGIDSLDAVELVVTLQKKYKVRIDSEETSRKVLDTLTSLTDFVKANQK